MSPKAIRYLTAYLMAGSLLIEILDQWIAFKLAFATGMALCFLISFISKMKIMSLIGLSGLYSLLLYLDNAFSLYWISGVKQSDWIAAIGSGVLFSLPGIIASILSRLLKFAKEKINARSNLEEGETAHNTRQ